MNMDEVKVEEGFKRCSKCGQVKPIGDFNKCKRASDGLQSYCKQCKKDVNAAWYAKHPTYNTDYYANNKGKLTEYQAEWYNPQTHPLNWAKSIVKGYRQMDRDRGFDDSKTISAEWFLQNIAYRPCAHCGLQAIGLIGCNRLDNTKGHTIDNVEPCCFKCNARENIRDQLERGLHVSCKHKKQSFKDFVNEHKAKDKNLS